jgi:predicted metal-dependent hydrolase
MSAVTEYDPRYLQGIDLFNQGDYFDAHEVWEDLWHDTAGPERRFYQALIQVAVAVYHASNGNARGARRLYHSARRYMQPFGTLYNGLNITTFWAALEGSFQELLDDTCLAPRLRRDSLPTLVLTPDVPSP